MRKAAMMVIMGVIVLTGCGYQTMADVVDKEVFEESYDGTIAAKPEQETSHEELSLELGEIYSDEVLTVTLTDYSLSGDIQLNFDVESNSDEDYSIGIASAAVNHVMDTDDSFDYITLPAGKKARMTLEISKKFIRDLGCEDFINDIEFAFIGYQTVAVWTSGAIELHTSIYAPMDPFYDEEEIFYSDDNYNIYYLGKEGNEYGFLVQNKSNSCNYLEMTDISVNDWVYDDQNSFVCIHPDAYVLYIETVDSDFLEETSIESIDKLEFKFRMYDAYTTTVTHPMETETITIQ